jgi:predicted nucleotidyltransferase
LILAAAFIQQTLYHYSNRCVHAATVDLSSYLIIKDKTVKPSLSEALFGSEVRAKLIRYLYVTAEPGKSFSERVIARHAGIAESNVHRPLNGLVAIQLLIKEETEEGPRYRAPHEDPRLKYLFLFLRQDSDIVQQIVRAMKKLKSVQYACVFGSFATGTTHLGSDIDVLVLESTDEERTEVLKAFSALSDSIGLEVNPQIYSTQEFEANLAQGDSIALSLVSTRIDVKGVPPWLT